MTDGRSIHQPPNTWLKYLLRLVYLDDLPIDIRHKSWATCPAHKCHQPFFFDMHISTRPLLKIVTEYEKEKVTLEREVLEIKH